MKRRSFLNQSGQLGLILFLAPQLIGCKEKGVVTSVEVQEVMKQFNFETAKDLAYTIKHVGGNIWSFEERGGTIGFYVDKEHIAVIDTQFPEQSNHLLEEIKAKVDRPINYLINTHHHGDHTSGNPAYDGIAEKHVAHVNSLKNQKASAEAKGTVDMQKFPTTLFDDEWTGSLGDETIRMRYYGAAHTDGDAVTTFVNSNVVHMGDLVFNRRFPYIDKSAGANIENWVSVLDKTISDHNAETKYIFGHSDNGFPIQGTSEDLKAFQNYLEKLLLFGMEAKKSGKSLEEIKKSTTIIPGAEEWKGKGIERSLDALYEELG